MKIKLILMMKKIHIKIFSGAIDQNETKLEMDGLCEIHFQNCVCHPFPPSKMATVTKNIMSLIYHYYCFILCQNDLNIKLKLHYIE